MARLPTVWLAGVLILLGVDFLGSGSAFAGNGELERELSELKARTAELERKVAKQGSQIEGRDAQMSELKEIKEALGRINIGGGITGVVQASDNNEEANTGEGDVTDGAYSVDLEIESPIGEKGAAFLHIEGGEGAGIDDDVLSLSGCNADANNTAGRLEVTEAWYEHSLLDKALAFTIGKLDLTAYFDGNEVANDETAQFLSSGFKNNLAVEFSDNGFGTRLTWSPIELLDLSLGLQDSDSDWENIFDHPFSIFEINLKPDFLGLGGNYRFYAWRNGSNHTKWEDASKTHEDNSGFGFSFDQGISDKVTLFARLGWQEEEVKEIKSAWSLGGELRSPFLSRPEDVFGIAYGKAILGGDYKESASSPTNDADEGHFEAYYNIKVNEHLSISPDVQVITEPNGNDSADTVTVFGTRCQIDF